MTDLTLWNHVRTDQLQWLPELGLGFYPVTADPYNQEYFDHYVECADTEIGRKLNAARVAFVKRHWHRRGGDGIGLVDIGIGAGTFLEAMPQARGFDVNPVGIKWLQERQRFVDPYREPVFAACFWDALEHIHNPAPLLDNVIERVFVSLPIFRDLPHVWTSKHYKPAEHCWYFTQDGFLWFMAQHGWRCIEINDDETRCGREDIESYAFERTP